MSNKIPFLERNIEYLKGVGPNRAELLRAELNIYTFGDLLFHFPFRYIDRSKIYAIKDLDESLPFIQVKGRISDIRKEGLGKAQRLTASLSDGSGRIDLVWFQGVKWLEDSLKAGTEYIAFGKPSVFRNVINITHPELSKIEQEEKEVGIIPVYSVTEKLRARGLDSKGISKLVKTLLENPDFEIKENLPTSVILRQSLLFRDIAFKNIHFPEQWQKGEEARHRLKFEEMFFMQVKIIKFKLRQKSQKTQIKFDKIGELFNEYYHNKLPFELTNAQKKVIKEIWADLKTGHQMNRLLQGDVGSGKTVVALISMLIANDNGYQACLMAPTEILATQHFESITKALDGMNVNVGLLMGSTKTAARKELAELLENGELHILIGTHALIEDHVKFKNLGLSVIDEQHRFGVAQRYKLWQKNTEPPHVLVMTATPIPRTLAMTVYGDLEISAIDELPVGRKPIRTVHRYERGLNEIYVFMKEQIRLGRQIYIVYPLIEESEKLDLQSLQEGFEIIKHHFPEPECTVGMLHGKMKSKEKEIVMKGFIAGTTHVLVSTTVIEVGVNVPNASVMAIMNAERFGLAQLHQLRGRVGRGADQSFCVLITSDKLGQDGRKRIDTMVQTTDGFKIAEVDMELRGPGDIDGTRQSGLMNLKLINIATDGKIIEQSRIEAERVLADDPFIKRPEHQAMHIYFEEYGRKNNDWSRVS